MGIAKASSKIGIVKASSKIVIGIGVKKVVLLRSAPLVYMTVSEIVKSLSRTVSMA